MNQNVLFDAKQTFPYLDLHVSGEPFRLLTEPFFNLEGTTMRQRRQFFQVHYDNIRKLILREPRGHDDMYGGILTPPLTKGSDFGMLFMYSSGMSSMCGHGMIATAKAAVLLGLVAYHEGHNTMLVDTPAAQVRAFADIRNGRVIESGFENDISFVNELGHIVDVPGIGLVPMDVAYGAAFMVFVREDDVGVDLDNTPIQTLVDIGMRCKSAFMEQVEVVHPQRPEVRSSIQGVCVILLKEPQKTHEVVQTRTFTVFGNQQYDRSPTGTGSSALAALLHTKGILKSNGKLINRGPVDQPFIITIRETANGVIPTLHGNAFVTAKGTFFLEDTDPLTAGYTSRGDME